MRRRAYLVSLGTIISAAIAGCIGDSGETDVDEDPGEILTVARENFEPVEYLSTEEEFELEASVSNDTGPIVEMSVTLETTTDHDLVDEAFESSGEAEVSANGQSETSQVEYYYIDEVLYAYFENQGWQSFEGVEFGIGGDINPLAFTDPDLLVGEEVVGLAGDNVVTVSVDEDRKHDFFTEGYQTDLIDEIEFEDFSQHIDIESAKIAVGQESELFERIEYESRLKLDAEEMAEYGMDPQGDDVTLEMETDATITIDEYDDPVDVSLPDDVPGERV